MTFLAFYLRTRCWCPGTSTILTMFSLLIDLDGGDLLQDRVVEGHVQVEGNTVETLETEYELVKQKFGFLKLGIIMTRTQLWKIEIMLNSWICNKRNGSICGADILPCEEHRWKNVAHRTWGERQGTIWVSRTRCVDRTCCKWFRYWICPFDDNY